MKRTVYKYQLKVMDFGLNIIDLPASAEILSVVAIRNSIFMYAAVDPDEKTVVKRQLRVVATGEPIAPAPGAKFLGTAVTFDGELIWHVFVEA